METAAWTVKAASAGEDLEITMHATDFYPRVEVSENMGVVLFYFYFFIFFLHTAVYQKVTTSMLKVLWSNLNFCLHLMFILLLAF